MLVADDEPLIRQALRRILEVRGHEVVTVVDAHKAIDELDAGPFDAVMVDERMPGDGRTVFSHLEEAGFTGTVVLMTGGHPTDVADLRDGVRRLQKPFPFRAVIPLVEGGPLL